MRVCLDLKHPTVLFVLILKQGFSTLVAEKLTFWKPTMRLLMGLVSQILDLMCFLDDYYCFWISRDNWEQWFSTVLVKSSFLHHLGFEPFSQRQMMSNMATRTIKIVRCLIFMHKSSFIFLSLKIIKIQQLMAFT